MNYTFNNSSIVSVNSGTIVLNVSGKTRTFVNAKLVSAVDGEIMLNLPKYTIQNGLYLVVQLTDVIERIFIAHSCRNYYIDYHVSQRNRGISYNQYWTDSSPIRNATPEEIEELDTQLAVEGKRWNPDTMQIEKLRWKPREGQDYYYIGLDSTTYICWHTWRNDDVDNEHYQSKNCFKTKEEAKSVMEKIKKLLLEV